MTSVIVFVLTVDWLRCEANCQTLLGGDDSDLSEERRVKECKHVDRIIKSKSRRSYIPGKPLSSDLRHIIIDKMIDGGGNPLTMIFPGRFVNLVSVEHASVLVRDPLLPSQPCFLFCDQYHYLRLAKRIQRLLF